MVDRRRRAQGDRGFVVAFTALAIVALFGLTAIVVDIGYAKQMRREAQGAADAAALAAAETMASGGTAGQAVAAAKRIAELNLEDLGASPETWATCQDGGRPDGFAVQEPTLTGGCVSLHDASRVVRVALPRVQSPSFFGRVLGRDDYDITAQAEAVYGSGRAAFGECGICGIDGAEFQYAHGSVDAPDDREIQADVLRINGNSNSIRPDVARYWLSNHSNNGKVVYSQLSGPVENPLSSVTVDYTGVSMHPEMNAGCDDLEPGYMYRQTVSIGSACTLPGPGIYYFKNGIDISGRLEARDGDRVTFVFGCASGTEMSDRPEKCGGRHTGNVNISGGLQLGAPFYGGVSLLWDETAAGSSVINYNGNVKLGGAYYSKGATPAFGNGTFRATGIVFGGRFRAATVNGGNIKIEDPSDDAGGSGDGGDVWLSR